MTNVSPSSTFGLVSLTLGFTVLTAILASVMGGFHEPMHAGYVTQILAALAVFFGLRGLTKDDEKAPAKFGLLLGVIMLIAAAGWM